jgi:lanosterol synthase
MTPPGDLTSTPTNGVTPHGAPLSRGAPTPQRRAREAIGPAQENLRRLQAEDGHWPGDYGGPMFLLPMLVALYHATGTIGRLSEARRAGMVTYFFKVQHDDGGIGLHADDPRGMLFTTLLGYVALRVLGVPADDARIARMRQWIESHGGPVGAAPWAKWTLCLLGLYDWRGVHPVPPELWLLPRAVPFHPSRLWCHCRQVYLPVAWLYARRASVREDDLVRALRTELYGGRWSSIDWDGARDCVSRLDVYRPASRVLASVNRVMDRLEAHAPRRLRDRALRKVLDHIVYEDDATSGIDIGPVNKVLNAFVHFFDDPDGPRLARALARTDDYLWDGPDGTKMQGYNGSQLWDTAFAVQALMASAGAISPADTDVDDVVARAYGFIRDNQILDDPPDRARHYRHASRGGWPFSTRAHGWPITDCTSEGLKCAIALAGRCQPAIPSGLLEDAVHLILSWQNDDGGWATYERQRAGAWMERLNPSEVFGDIMVDYSYVECTSACIQALVAAEKHSGLQLPGRDVRRAVARGVEFLRRAQLPDGSFEGSWAVCFTYGTWFGVSGLLAGGASTRDPAVSMARGFLLGKQRADGSWAEDGDSCRTHRWVEGRVGHVVQTSWALMTLVRAGHADDEPLHRAAAFLLDRQDPSGGWPKEALVGVFNRTCLIDYDNYRHYFPLLALSEYLRRGARTA